MFMPRVADVPPRPESPDERRRYPRVEIVSETEGRSVDLDMAVSIRDVSRGGFLVESPIAFPIDCQHTFLFSPGESQQMTVLAACRHCRPVDAEDGRTAFLAGFEFVPQSFGQLTLILDMVARLVSDRSGRS